MDLEEQVSLFFCNLILAVFETRNLGILDFQVAATVDKPKDGVRRRKTRFNWKLPNDIALAKSVLQNTPFKQPRNRKTAAWMKVATEINELFKTNLDAVAVSRHYDIIVDIHRKEETKNRYA